MSAWMGDVFGAVVRLLTMPWLGRDWRGGLDTISLDLKDDGAVHHSIQERRRQRRISQVVAPRLEVDVRHHRRGTLPAPRVDDLEQQVGRLRRLLPLDVIEPELI